MRLRDLLLLGALPLALTTACLESDKDDEDDDGGSGGDTDSDGDGLSDAEEEELGTDPSDADSDGDGQQDGEEVTNGTSPTNPYSLTYAEGGYNVGACAEPPDATDMTGGSNGYYDTWGVGDVVENFTLEDQYGQEVHLYSFCGQHVMLAFGAMWCGPCQDLADNAQSEQDEFGPEGFQVIEILIGDLQDNPPDQDDLVDWMDDHDLETVPVLNDGSYEVWPYYEKDFYIPTVVHIGPDMTVLAIDTTDYSPSPWL